MIKYNVEWIDINLLHEDHNNPNAMNEREFNALIQEISKYGIIEPIVTRTCKCNSIHLEHRCIIGGEHRFRAAKQLNMKEVPCINLDVNDTQAKMIMVNLNRIHGRIIPLKLANLIVNMSKSIPLDEICKGFYITKDEIKDILSNKNIINTNNTRISKDKARIKWSLSSSVSSNLKVLSILLSKEQYEEVITVLDLVADKYNCTRGEALITICRRFKMIYNCSK